MTDPTPELTDESYWDGYWQERVQRLPLEVTRERSSLQVRAILDVIDAYLPAANSSVLEVGGAPGQYLAYFHRRCLCKCAILDYSSPGCALARENFRALGTELAVYERDLLAADLTERFDFVYSLGLIEHFVDYVAAVEAHAKLVRRGGILLIGMPNFRGVNGWFARHIDLSRFESHNLDAMNVEDWDAFEQSLELQRLFRGHVGGFEPGVFATAAASAAPGARLTAFTARALSRVLTNRFAAIRRLNPPWLSGYLMGIWRLPS